MKRALGAAARQDARTPGAGTVPELSDLIALRALSRSGGGARRGSHGVQTLAPSRLLGRGMEYAESRRYVPGDDARLIDWRVTARTGRTYTKLFQAERERLTLIVADTAPALYFGTRVRFKSVQAARAGALAAWQAVRDGDRIAALRGSLREGPIPPASGPRGALRVLDALVRWYRAPAAEDAGLALALDRARRLLRPGSRLVVLADPASIVAIPETLWPGLARHIDAHVLLLTDPLERRPPVARLPFAIAGGRLELGLDQAGVRQRWKQAFDGPLDEALSRLSRFGLAVAPLSADAPVEVVRDLLQCPSSGRVA